MKKIFYFIVAILAVSMVSCNRNNQVTYDYTLELSVVYNEEISAPEITVTLSEEGQPFVLVPFKSADLGNAKDAEIFEAVMQVYGSSLASVAHDKSGTYTFPDMSWVPNTQYTIVGFIVNINTLEQKSAVAKAEVTIPEKSGNVLSLQYDNDSCLNIAATTKDPYYYALVTEEIYDEQIGSGNTTIAQFVAESFKADLEYFKEYLDSYYENVTYALVADMLLLSGSQTVNLVEDYGELSAGNYYAVAAGIEYTTDELGVTANPTTEGVAIKLTLAHDYIWVENSPAKVRSLNGVTVVKPARNINFKVDLKKMYRAQRVK